MRQEAAAGKKTATKAGGKATVRSGSAGKSVGMRGQWKTVDEYLAAQPEVAQTKLKQVRSAVRKVLRGAGKTEEVISYGIPAYKLNGRVVIYFAAFKEHYSLYPASDAMVEAVPELAPYRVSKGTLKFAFDERVPVTLVEEVVRWKVGEAARG